MKLAKSQEKILHQLKTRGPQTVKILAKQLDMTTMGVRQHLMELVRTGMVDQTSEEKQTRGRPVHLWKLNAKGHGYFPDSHQETTIELIELIREKLGEETVTALIDSRTTQLVTSYKGKMPAANAPLPDHLGQLARLRSQEGYMAEIRLLPNGCWLLIENHCSICKAAEHCRQFCRAELELFQTLLQPLATVERVDYLLAGDRRCSYRVTATVNSEVQ